MNILYLGKSVYYMDIVNKLEHMGDFIITFHRTLKGRSSADEP